VLTGTPPTKFNGGTMRLIDRTLLGNYIKIKSKPKLNIKGLLALKARLETLLDTPEEAARFNMKHFGTPFRPSLDGTLGPVPVCLTQACLAGETVLALGTGQLDDGGGISIINPIEGVSNNWGVKYRADKDLGLTEAQSYRLFFFKNMTGSSLSSRGYGWPTEYEQMYLRAKTPQGRLYAAILRVDKFIQTKGRV
jgi:hypothetical protein